MGNQLHIVQILKMSPKRKFGIIKYLSMIGNLLNNFGKY